MIMMCGPTWNSSPVPIALDLLGTQKPPYIYETPTLCTLGVRPATLSLMKCRKTWSKRPGSSWADPGKARKTGPPIGASLEKVELTAGHEVGQSSSVAFRVTDFGPAPSADAIFSESDFELLDAGV